MQTKQVTHQKKLVPLGDRVLLIAKEKNKDGRKTEGGIIIPQSVDEKDEQNVAKVAEVSPNVKELKVGDTVIFSKYGIQEITIDNKTYLVADLENIIAKYI